MSSIQPNTTSTSPPVQSSTAGALSPQYAELATLAGGLAHEVRNPLSTIRMNLDLLGEELEEADAPQVRRMGTKLERIRRECTHLEQILTAFLQFARAGELNLVRGDLKELISEFIAVYKPQARQQKIDISPHIAADLPPVMMDPGLMRQVLMNLALNSQQAMPEGGLLEIQAYSQDGRVCIEFIDTGCGMDERAREKMFQIFFSTKSGGSGLGLPTVRKIIEAHQGTISCDSEPGKGTRFTISLPAAPAE